MDHKSNSQMLKGILSGCILVLLDKEELYGYTLSERLSDFGFNDIAKGTIYPLLLSLEKKKLILGNFRESDAGPKRKYYELSKAGKQQKDEFVLQWMKLKNNVTNLMKEEDSYENK